MEYCDNRSQHQREETIQKKKKKRSAKDDDELPHSKKLGSSEDDFVFSTRRVTRSASKQQHQQQHGEGKKQKKPVRSCWREMTDEELEAYKKKAEGSEGFDVGEVPVDISMNIIIPCSLDRPASALRPYNKMAKKALAAYNDDTGTKYKFVKHVRVNRKGGACGSSYFITFHAKDKKAGSQNFQTAVFSHRDLIKVRFCRVEKKLEEPQAKVEEDSGFKSESFQLHGVSSTQVYGNSSNGCRSDEGEAKLFPHMNLGGLEQGQEDLLIQSDERKTIERGESLPMGERTH